MNAILYVVVLTVITFLRVLPLAVVALIGRAGGMMAYGLDARHRRVALKNLTRCFVGGMSSSEIRAIARENFRRIGESYACAIKTAFMPTKALRSRVEVIGAEKIQPFVPNDPPQNRIVAIGHFGNFEIYARLVEYAPGFTGATTYRGLRQPSLNRLMQSLRERSGCLFFERRTDGSKLKAAMSSTGLLLGLLADQHAGNRGLRLPFLGHECSTSAAPAVLALRYRCPLYTAICYRVGLARWQVEVGDEIPTRENGEPRSVEEISLDMNRALEAAVRRDPANWFWVHERWKPPKRNSRPPCPAMAEVNNL